MRAKIPARKKDSHKGMNGTVCVVGGSRIYHGAPFHCAMGAARVGVDLVYLAVPTVIVPPIRAMSPDLIVYPLPDGKLTRGAASRLAAWVPDVDVVAIGPGLGQQNPGELKSALALLGGKCKSLVVDADAIRTVLLEEADTLRSKTIVTPHAGEFERLFGAKPPQELDKRVDAVKQAASKSGLAVLLKGPIDVISDGEGVGLNSTHSPAMTVGGTGDVLTGVVSGLAAKGLSRFDAACSAAYVNGLAGADAASDLGMHIVASDVVSRIPKMMKRFDRLE